MNAYVERRGRPHARGPRHPGHRGLADHPPARHGRWLAGSHRRRACSTSSATPRSSSCRGSRRSPRVRLYAKLEGQNPTGSIKDRVAKAMIEAAEASGELEPGRAAAGADERQHRDLARARRQAQGLPAHVRDARRTRPRSGGSCSSCTARDRRVARRPGLERRRPPGAARWPSSDPRWFMPFQYANEANPRAHYEGTGAEIAEALDRVDVLVAGLGTGGTLMGTGARLRESFPDVVVAAAEPLPGDPVMGLRSLEDGYVPPILDVSKLDRKVLVSNEESVRGLRALLDREGILAGVSSGAVVHVARKLAAELRRGRRRLRAPRRRLEVPVGAVLAGARRRVGDGGHALVVIPAAVREAIAAHAREEEPNESCGLLALRDGVADRYLPADERGGEPVPLRAEAARPARLLPRGRGLRARRRPLAPLVARRGRRAPTSRTSASGPASSTSSTRSRGTSWRRGRSPRTAAIEPVPLA